MASYGPPATSQEEPDVAVEVDVTVIEVPDLETRVDWVDAWEDDTRDARALAMRDREYYDGKQWTDEEIRVLNERKQPVLTKNKIKRKVDFILGEVVKKRTDPVARPRTPQHEDASRAATDALRYVEEEQKLDRVESAVAKNMLTEGIGGSIKEIDDGDNYKHCLRHIEYDRLIWDPHSRAPDFSDAKYLGAIIWMDIEDAIAAYPDAEDALRQALAAEPIIGGADSSTEDTPRLGRWADRKRQRVKLCELYFRVGDDWLRADFTKTADLREPDRTSYMDESGERSVCPLKMASCYVDSEGHRYGVVRALISPQDEINKRSSKALHLLSVRQVIAERDAILDPQKFQTELAKPDGYAEVEPGALQEQRIQTTQTGDLAQGQLAMLQEAKQDIDSIGPSSSTLPDLPNGASGRAFVARQQAASQELGSFFDELRAWKHSVYELDWLCIRQYWTEEKWLRVTDDQELTGYRFVALNRQITRAQRFQELVQKNVPPDKALSTAAGEYAPVIMAQVQQQAQAMAQQMGPQAPPQAMQQLTQQLIASHPLMGEQITENQVDQMLVDIVIDEAPETAVIAQEEFATLSDLLPTVVNARPDMAPEMVKMLIRASDLSNKRELLQSLEKGPDPQQAQQQEQMQKLQMAAQQAGVQVATSQSQLNQARAAQANAEAQVTGPKAQAEVESKHAKAMHDAASAGEKAGGAMQQQPPGAM